MSLFVALCGLLSFKLLCAAPTRFSLPLVRAPLVAPPIACGSNSHGPDNAPLCFNLIIHSQRLGALTLLNATVTNTTAIVPPPRHVPANGSAWYSVHDGEYWPPNAHVSPWRYDLLYTGPCVAGCRRNVTYEIGIYASLQGAYDISVSVPKGLQFGGNFSNDPFVATIVIFDAWNHLTPPPFK
jgi:hypothetical protein